MSEILPFFEIVEGQGLVGRERSVLDDRFDITSFGLIQYMLSARGVKARLQIESLGRIAFDIQNDHQSGTMAEIQARCTKEAKQTFGQLALILREYGV